MGLNGNHDFVGATIFAAPRKWKINKEKPMNCSKQRHDGGAYRRYKTMVAAHAKPGKDRGKARRKQPKRKKAGKS